tara:strand:+ start:535 stop:867 length:333 start_codon:yes stop_codon:yes gene_type:complete
MEYFNMITNIGIALVILSFFYFIYTLQVLATKKPVNFIKAKCPDYWDYDADADTCTNSDGTEPKLILLSNHPTDCKKYNYSKNNNLVWSGISNNFKLIEKCNRKKRKKSD